jgi:hypothetical protein
MISFKHTGDLSKTYSFLRKFKEFKYMHIFNRYGREGVLALENATPKDTGVTSKSWSYKIDKTSKGYSLSWINTNVINGVSIAIIIQYGYATRSGGYVQGRDYINPAIQPVFDKLTNALWKEVQSV